MPDIAALATQLTVDEADYVRGMKRADDASDKFADNTKRKIGGLGGIFSGALGGVNGLVSGLGKLGLAGLGIGVIRGLVDAVGDLATASANETLENNNLLNSIKNSDKAFAGSTETLNALVAAGEAKAFGDSEVRDSLAKLTATTNDVTKASQLQSLAMNVARSRNISLGDATKILAKAQQGSLGGLEKLGVEISETSTLQSALAELTRESAGAADLFAESSVGAGIRASAAWENAKEDIGSAILPLQSQILGGFAAFLTGPEFQGAISWLTGVMSNEVPRVLGIAKEAFDAVAIPVRAFAEVLTNAFSSGSARLDLLQQLPEFLQPIGKILGDVAGNIGEFVSSVQAGGDPLTGFGELVKNNLIDTLGSIGVPPDVVSNVQGAMETIGGAISDITTGFQTDGIGGALDALAEKFPIIQGPVQLFKDTLAGIQDTVSDVADGFTRGGIAGAIDALADKFPIIQGPVQLFKDTLTGIQDTVSDVAAAFERGGLGGAIDALADKFPIIQGPIDTFKSALSSVQDIVGKVSVGFQTGGLGGAIDALATKFPIIQGPINTFKAALTGIQETLTAVAAGFQTGGLGGAIDALAAKFPIIQGPVQLFKDTLAGIQETVTAVAEGFQEGGLGGAIDALTEKFTFLEPVGRILGDMLPPVLAVAAAFAGWAAIGAVVGALGAAVALLTSPIALLVAGFVGLGALFVESQGGLDGLMAKIQPVIDAFGTGGLGGALTALGQSFPALQGPIDTLRAAFDSISSTVAAVAAGFQTGGLGGAIDALAAKFPALQVPLDTVKTALTTLVDAGTRVAAAFGATGLAGVWELLTSSATSTNPVLSGISSAIAAMQPIVEIARGVWDNLSAKFAEIAGTIGPQFALFWTNLQPALATLQPIFESLVNIITTVGTVVASVLGGVLVVAFSAAVGVIQGFLNFLPSLGTIISGVFETVRGVLDFFVALITGVVDTVGALLRGDFAGAWEAVTTMIGGMGEAVGTILSGLWTTIQGLFTGGIALVTGFVDGFVDTIVGIIDGFIPGFKTTWDTFWSDVSTTVTNIWNALTGVIGNKIEEAKTTIDTVTTGISLLWNNFWGTVSSKVTEIWNTITGEINRQINAAKTTIDTVTLLITNAWNTFWADVSSKVTEIWDTITGTINTQIETAKATIGTVTGLIKTAWDTFWNDVSTKVTDIWNTITTGVSTQITLVQTTIGEVAGTIKTAWDTFWDNIWTTVSTTWDTISTGIGTKLGEIKTLIEAVPGQLATAVTSIGSGIVQGIIDGITGAWNGITTAIGNLAKDLPQPIKDALGIKSPSEEMADQVGAPIPAGILAGIQAGWPALLAGVEPLLATLTASFKTATDPGVETSIAAVWRAGWQAMTSAASTQAAGLTAVIAALLNKGDAASLAGMWWAAFEKQREGSIPEMFKLGLSEMFGQAQNLRNQLEQAIFTSAFFAELGSKFAQADGWATAWESAMGRIVTAALATGQSISAGIAAGIESGKSSVIDAAVGVATAALQAAKSALGITSPSKAYYKLGLQSAQGYAAGLEDGAASVRLPAITMLSAPLDSAVVASFSANLDQLMAALKTAADRWGKNATRTIAEFGGATLRLVEGLQAALELMRALADPKLRYPTEAAVVGYFNVLDMFVTQFRARGAMWQRNVSESKAAIGSMIAGLVTDLLGPVEALAALATPRLPGAAIIDGYFRTLDRFIDLFLERADRWASGMSVARTDLAGRVGAGIADLLAPVSAIGDLFEFVAPAAAEIDSFFASAQAVLERFANRAAIWQSLVSEQALQVAAGVREVFDSVAAAVSAIGAIGELPELPWLTQIDAVFDSIQAVLDRYVGLMAHPALVGAGMSNLSLFAQNLLATFEALAATALRLPGNAPAGGAGTASMGMASGMSLAPSAAASGPVNVQVNIYAVQPDGSSRRMSTREMHEAGFRVDVKRVSS